MGKPEHQEEATSGVKKIELYKKVWTKRDKIVMFVGLYLLGWAINWEGNLSFYLVFPVTNAFGTNNLQSLMPTVLYILQSVLLPTYSKLSDMLGRVECYTISLAFYIIAEIVMATAQNYYTIVGGQVIYAFGYAGCLILGPIVIGDMTDVLNRGLFQALYAAPSLINVFVTPLVGAALADSGNWRWGYGQIPILLVVTSAPLLGGLWHVQNKAKKAGLIKKYEEEHKTDEPKKTIGERLIWLANEIDIIGCLLFVGFLTLVLLPLVLALTAWGGWGSPITIGTICGGVVCGVLFCIWEWKYAVKPVIPLGKWEDKTPIYGVLALSTVTIISATNWQFFNTYLVISRKISVTKAMYLGRGYNVAYVVFQLVSGYLMKRTRKWRPLVWAGVSMLILGVGLMIPARLPTSSDAFVVISETIAGMGSGMLDIPIMVAIQSSVPHNDLAIVTAMMQVGGSIAASIGSTMAGAIWNSMLPGQLAEHVPGEYDYASIVGSTIVATSLPDDQYAGVVHAYGYVQKILSIIAICIAGLTLLFTLPMKGFGLENRDDDEKKSVSDIDDLEKDSMDKEYVAEEKEDVPEANYLEENHPQGDHRV